jgi:undecaprenyl-diphosphatase
MELWQALVLGALQGISELFPVSSLAQIILIPALLHWGLDQTGKPFLAFVVALHLATAIALLLYFWRDWLKVLRGLAGCVTRFRLVYDDDSKFAWLLVAGTVVVGAVGLVGEKKLRNFFENPAYVWLVAVFLILNGGVMLLGDWVKHWAARRAPTVDPEHEADAKTWDIASALTGSVVRPVHAKRAEDLSFAQATAVGAVQTLALLPGISRSGVTIVGGLLAGLTYEQATRFSFMLATPVIGLAAVLKVPELLKPENRDILHVTIPAAIVAGLTAFLSTAFLMRWFKSHRLAPFGVYCVLFGALALYLIKTGWTPPWIGQ